MAAAPFLTCNVLAGGFEQSLAFLLVGFALSEMWRAPAAIMIRDLSPSDLGSTGSALHLCIRNLIGSSGPLCGLPGTCFVHYCIWTPSRLGFHMGTSIQPHSATFVGWAALNFHGSCHQSTDGPASQSTYTSRSR